ncbi:MAG: DNA protecting protein DprA [Sphingobacteriales bacterium 17-39-43]|uniref:DNA-processing protein DprA n=1 Tax=Daejeonella sp. TaxID=2805397 RepID=UPI000BCBB09B|nr:DNA-processing protein DprA [Daejeonella sp.]OYY01748.1 MAG: DNA protecting protein DprA [Sphingobacteriia bacterium 35-40-5]OYZ33190.1 MAG: DNA protecting protein DprA [Sphingobacteriales bacterium 16-39-50]OZA26599.1 MAG: DNA protecting protein DprA [Sphingobacteriales bacterium 17-39-43]HQT21756.1 DNA-processing protein DprA [Daejeonella sp.]HQT56487.1 DNA-processing protein DprA [Daejeonella sp.]
MALLHQLALSCIPGIGSVLARNLLSYCGDAEEVFKAKAKNLAHIPGIGPKTLEFLKEHSALKRAEQELKFIDKFRIKAFFLTDDDYPKRLRNCADAPIIVYFKGNADLNASKVISIVGTRNATDYGKEICRTLVEDLKIHQPLIISGLAYGIDGAAHKEALKNNIPNVAVLAHGLDRIYPAQHRTMAEKILDCGGLITEFMSGTIPDRENFPKRNRIIAGLADLTIVVEANIKGGALITAELANSYNRDVFAYPGRINDEFSQGCNFLIKTNRANLMNRVADIEYLMGWTRDQALPLKPQLSLPINLTADEQIIANILYEKGSLGVDDLAILSGFQQSKLVMVILGMEMQGSIISLPGKVYKMT